MKKFTKALIVFAMGAAAGAYASKNKAKIKKEIDRMVKQGKIKAGEGKDLMGEVMKDVNSRAKYERGKATNKISDKLKKVRKRIGPPKKKAIKAKVKKTVRKVKKTVKKKK